MTIILYAGHNITLEREQIIHVDGVVIPISSLPFVTTDYHVQIELVGGWIKVELSCGVYLMWDQVKWIDIYLPITFQGRTMGKLGRRRLNIETGEENCVITSIRQTCLCNVQRSLKVVTMLSFR